MIDVNDCIEWDGPLDRAGYGRVRVNGQLESAHREVFIETHGSVPDDLDIDHLCRNRACINVDHLEAVSHKENVLRGESFAARNARKTHCPKGHPYSGDNLYVSPTGARRCRACKRTGRPIGWAGHYNHPARPGRPKRDPGYFEHEV